jgi:cytochrome c biogenesis protein ResB
MRFWRASLAGCLIFAGCAAHKQVASKPPVAPTSENAIRVLSSVPRSGYDKLGTVTILQNLEEPANRNFAAVREIAARAGANALFLQQEKAYTYRSGFNQCTKGRIIVYSLIRLR